MSEFSDNFRSIWEKSFGDHIRDRKPLPPGIYPEGTVGALEDYTPPSPLRRIWNDAVLGGDHKSREYGTPLPVKAARGVGATLGIGSAVATVGTSIAGLFTSTAAIPVLPVIGAFMGLGTAIGLVHGILTKPEPKKPHDMLVCTDPAYPVSRRTYEMVTVEPPAPGLKDKIEHITDSMVEGWKMPLVGLYRAINTPIRLAGYGIHAANVARQAYEQTHADDTPAPPVPPGP